MAKLPAHRTVAANLSAQQGLPPFGEAQLEHVEGEPVPRRVLSRERVPAKVFDGDARVVADRIEADVDLGLFVGREGRVPPTERQPVRRLPCPDPSDLE